MNKKPKLKVKHKVEDLISFIEQNNLENVKKIIESDRKIVKKTRMDENEAIYYAIKFKCNKIFSYILDNSDNAKYDVLYSYLLYLYIYRSKNCLLG